LTGSTEVLAGYTSLDEFVQIQYILLGQGTMRHL